MNAKTFSIIITSRNKHDNIRDVTAHKIKALLRADIDRDIIVNVAFTPTDKPEDTYQSTVCSPNFRNFSSLPPGAIATPYYKYNGE